MLSTQDSASDVNSEKTSTYVTPGMPSLSVEEKPLSFFEFWPVWVMYLPVVVQWLILSIRYRSLTLPLLANPGLPLSGMVGVPKSQLLDQAQGECKASILPWFLHARDYEDEQTQIDRICAKMSEYGFSFPVVCKPDIGCRGAGVRLVADQQALARYIALYPQGADIMVQQVASYEPEVGVFFVREPNQETGQIISLALKYTPYVVGDGQSTLRQLIQQDPRASKLEGLYTQRHAEQLEQVLAKGEAFKLVFSASHCRGAIFRNAEHLITPALVERVNSILSDLPEFHYGRMDVKFADIDALEKGDDLQIIEINTASSESLHIWDSQTSFSEAVGSLLRQYRLLFKIGQQNRKRGYTPPGIISLLKHWTLERRLTRLYPSTD